MKMRMGICGGFLAALGLAAGASAEPVAGPGCAAPVPCLPGPGPSASPGAAPSPYQPTNPGENNAAQPETSGANQAGAGQTGSSFASEGRFQGGLFGSTLTAAGTGLASATATTATGTGGTNNNTQSASSPLILPGLFTASQTESARPMDRVFFDYGYFDSFRTAFFTGTPPNVQSRTGFGFNLNRYDFGVEKTFFDGRASAIVRVPFLDASNNVSGQPIDGLGDIDAGFKVALLLDPCSGSVLSAGLDVDAPTGRDQQFTTKRTTDFTKNPATVTVVTTNVNPTFLQPYVVGLLNGNGLFVQDFFGVIVPTDGRVATLINEDLSVGYQIYHCPERMLSSITPTVEAQLLVPTNHEGTGGSVITLPPGAAVPTTVTAFNFPDQLFLTEGVQFGLGERSVLSVGIVEPVVGPRAFTIGVTAGFNFFY